MTTEQLVEQVLIEAFPGQSQNQKQTYRFEIEAMVKPAMVQLGREVAAGPDYQVLQRSVVLPVLASHEIDYDRFGPNPGAAGGQPVIDNGIVFGDSGAFAISTQQRLTLSGSPLRVRNQYIEWQYLTVTNNASVGVLPVFSPDVDIADPFQWNDLIKIGTAFATADVYANGVLWSGVIGPFSPGDYVRFQWDANGDLFITQFDANRTVVTLDYPVIGGEVTVVANPGIVFLGDGGQVSVGRMGSGTSTSLTPVVVDGLYRVDLVSGYQFLTSFLDENGMVQFNGTTKNLSWVPSLNYRGQASRCDSWYWTLDGEQIVFWPGSEGDTLPATSLRVQGSIVPSPVDLPADYDRRAIDILLEKVRVRAGMKLK